MADKIIPAPNVPPFVTFVTSAVPMVFDNSLSYYEALCALWKWLQDDVVDVINNNAEVTQDYIDLTNEYTQKFIELKEYVDTYFDNLDVQEEINNKLDAMVEDGTLQTLIDNFLQPNVTWTFNTVAEMKDSEQLVDGTYARTLGYFTVNDGGGSVYKIRSTQPSTYYETLTNGLYAELVYEKEMNLTQFGVDHTSTDVTVKLNDAITECSQNGVTLIIPAHTYTLKTTLTKSSGGYSYAYFIDAISNMHIKGVDKDKSIIKVSDENINYTSVFLNEENDIKDISLENFTIQQYYASGSNINPNNRQNNKNAFTLYGVCKNISINNMFFKNCCGVDVIAFHSNSSENISVTGCEFDYHYVRDISYYDRSIIYMECHNYIVKENIVNGNFETLGGIECHGYKGVCSNNIVNKCDVGIHIAPKYDDDIVSAEISVDGNIMKDCAKGIMLWYNTSSTATVGCSGISICNNIIKSSGSLLDQTFFKSGGLTTVVVAGITPAPTADNKKFSNITIDSNIISLTGYSGHTTHTDTNLYQYAGISLAGRSDLTNIHITNNTIEGMAGNGINVCDNRYSASDFSASTNIIIANNSILNCGYGIQSENTFKVPLIIGRGIVKNVIVRNNIISKTDDSYTYAYAALNQGGSGTTKENVYFTNNIIYTSSNVADETKVINSAGYYTLITDRGDTTNRPTTANAGDQYFDTTLGKVIVYNGTAWVNVDGTSL